MHVAKCGIHEYSKTGIHSNEVIFISNGGEGKLLLYTEQFLNWQGLSLQA